jgi:hypothetical protein
MRHRLVHNYVVDPDGYSFTTKKQTESLYPLPASVLVVDDLVNDIQRAGDKLVRLARVAGPVRSNVLDRLRKRGLLWMLAFPRAESRVV